MAAEDGRSEYQHSRAGATGGSGGVGHCIIIVLYRLFATSTDIVGLIVGRPVVGGFERAELMRY